MKPVDGETSHHLKEKIVMTSLKVLYMRVSVLHYLAKQFKTIVNQQRSELNTRLYMAAKLLDQTVSLVERITTSSFSANFIVMKYTKKTK